MGSLRTWLVVAALAPASCGVSAQSAATPTPQIYTCTDASGRRLTSDRPITACSDREQTILNPSGTVKAKVGPVLSPIEQGQSEARIRAEQKERAKKEEEKRMARALLVRYPNPAAHQKSREEAVAQIKVVQQVAIKRQQELQAEHTKLSDEMAFYVKDPGKAPPKLQRQLATVKQALTEQERFLADKDKEIQAVHARFDQERQRLEPLWQTSTAADTSKPAR